LKITDPLFISFIGSVIATITVLSVRAIFYKIRDYFPISALFNRIKNRKDRCYVYIIRMKDIEKSGKFITPIPDYKAVIAADPNSKRDKYQPRQNIPWVTSTQCAEAMSHILNLLGIIGRTENIIVTFPDRDYDKWDSPMFILGGSWKSENALEMFDHYYDFRDKFKLTAPTDKDFTPQNPDEDIGLVEKLINPDNDMPIWIIVGYRGAGTTAAAYALLRWRKYLGKIYGKKRFGFFVSMNDRVGWQQSKIVSIYPLPKCYKKILHPIAWNKLKVEE
jgi:hypothetical protein